MPLLPARQVLENIVYTPDGMGFLIQDLRIRADFPPGQTQYRVLMAFPMW